MKLTNLNEQLKGHKEVSEQQLQLANTQLNDLKSQLAKKSSIPCVVWLIILLIAVVAGILIGHFPCLIYDSERV